MDPISDLLGVKELLDLDDFGKLAARMVINVICASLVIRRHSTDRARSDYRLTYYLFNIITFSLCFLLRKVPIELGFALGLFAVFGILRYRTEPISVRDLTYLFAVIGLAIVNAVTNKKVSLAELMLVNMVIVGATILLQASRHGGELKSYVLIYDNLDVLQQDDPVALREDVEARTGMAVERVEITKVDLLRDTATLTVRRREPAA